MMQLGTKLYGWLAHRSRLTSVVMFVGCLVIYLANGRLMISGDSLPTSIWLFNLLENHTLTFGNLRHTEIFQNGIDYYFSQMPNGDWVTIYPIGPAILTAPIYLLFYLQYKLTHLGAPLNLLTADFEMQRRGYERLAAAILTASSVVIFFHVAKARFRPRIALISAMLFGFATTTWTVSAQALWQHGPMNFCVLASLLAVLKSETALARSCYLLFAGAAAGLLIGIRPTAIVYIAAISLYVLFTQGRQWGKFLLGCLSCLPIVAWNLYYFQHIFGGYSRVSASGFHQLGHVAAALPGVLFSPSRGFFVYTPVMLFVLLGLWQWAWLWRQRSQRSIDWLFLSLFGASLPIFLSYFFVLTWWGGYSYGPRFYTDILPAWCLMLTYGLEWFVRRSSWRPVQIGLAGLFGLSSLFSIGVQAIGVGLPLSARDWNDTPFSIDLRSERAWQWRDSQLERHFWALHNQPHTKQLLQPSHVAQLSGRIHSVMTEDGNIVTAQSSNKVRTSEVKQYHVILRPQVENLSNQTWYGYQTGLASGMPYLEGKLFDQQEQLVHQTSFFFESTVPAGQIGSTIGAIHIPGALMERIRGNSAPTPYRLDLALKIYGLQTREFATYTVPVNLEATPSN